MYNSWNIIGHFSRKTIFHFLGEYALGILEDAAVIGGQGATRKSYERRNWGKNFLDLTSFCA